MSDPVDQNLRLYKTSQIKDVADAIRDMNGTEDTYTLNEMPGAIRSLPVGGGGSSNLLLSGDCLYDLPVISGTKPYGVRAESDWTYDQYGFYSTANWENLDFETVDSLPTSGGGQFLAFPITITAVFMSEVNAENVHYISNPEYWLISSVTITEANELVEFSEMTGVYGTVRPEGFVRIQNREAGDLSSYRLIAVKAEKGSRASDVVINNVQKLMMKFAKAYGDIVKAAANAYTDAATTPTKVRGTLTAGSTTLVLEDVAITTDCTLEIATSIPDIRPTVWLVAEGSLTLTFDAQGSDMVVEVIIT